MAALLTTLVLLLVGYFVGSYLEREHLASLREREQRFVGLQAVTMRDIADSAAATEVSMVMGSAVVSVDYFKRFLAGLRMFVGGRLGAYETVLDRGRREALLRMKEEAHRRGFDAVINVRLETARLAASRGDGKGTAGVEVLAFGTALKLPSDSPFARKF